MPASPMTLESAMTQLAAFGSPQTLKTYSRHGITPPAFGVLYGDLGKLKKQIKRDHGLARALWTTGNHDARVLATLIADPHQADSALLEAWKADLTNYVLTDAFSRFAATVPGIRDHAAAWIDADHEWIAAAGWNVLAALLETDAIDDEAAAAYLARIEGNIHTARNRVRYSMNQALIAIGLRGGAHTPAALACADRIGSVLVDHGETGCKTPAAAAYIQKTLDYRASKIQAGGDAAPPG